MDVYDAITKRRTIRKFKQDDIPLETLQRLVEAARIAPASANIQPLTYIIVHSRELVDGLFPLVAWAGYIAPDGNPAEGERPVAYIIILIDSEIHKGDAARDVGAAAENLMLAAMAEGLGTCWMGAIERPKIAELLGVPEHLKIDTLISLGRPAEEPVMEEMTDSIKYYKDSSGTLHVPKRALSDILKIM
ncbi:MAG: nitroreductase family protein [Phycisphaerae bacterium]|jgi:nitroreductase|nr:nitroreductase family protein [Phycisphaerae bacterium]